MDEAASAGAEVKSLALGCPLLAEPLAEPVDPLADDEEAPPRPLALAAAGPVPRDISGKCISITPTIPPPFGRIIRICGRPSSDVPNVTCPGSMGPPPLAPPPPPAEAAAAAEEALRNCDVKLANICCTNAASIGIAGNC